MTNGRGAGAAESLLFTVCWVRGKWVPCFPVLEKDKGVERKNIAADGQTSDSQLPSYNEVHSLLLRCTQVF